MAKPIHMQSFRSNRSKVFSAKARALGDQLVALVDAHINDPEKLATLVEKAGYAPDSGGQLFHGGKQVPTPSPLDPDPIKRAPVNL